MLRTSVFALSFLSLIMLSGCRAGGTLKTESRSSTEIRAESFMHEDGNYRGIFADGPDIQVNIEFTLKGGIVTDAKFRHLRRDENYNIDAVDEPYASVINQYREALNHLVGKSLKDHLPDLYVPQNLVSTEVDGYSGATIRSNKLISAIRDALNRGVYSY